jgi:hypothetical protein
MDKKTKNALIILAVSIVLAGVTVLLFLLDPEQGEAKLISSIIVPIWVFSIVPAFAFTYGWLKSKNYIEGFSFGVNFGLALGIFALIVPILIAPVLMILFFCGLFKNRKTNTERL